MLLTETELRTAFCATNTSEPLAEGWPGLERFAREVERLVKQRIDSVPKSARSKELAEAHWKDYVKGLLEAAGVDEAIVKACEFVYISSFIHGYKHAMQDVENSKKVFSEYNATGGLP